MRRKVNEATIRTPNLTAIENMLRCNPLSGAWSGYD
jgi:hypothetical protein